MSADSRAREAVALALAAGLFLGPRAGDQIGKRLLPMWGALKTGNYEFYFDAMGRPVGFVNWVLVDECNDAALLAGRLDPASIISCEAGKNLWILDFFAFDNSLRGILASLRDRFCGRYDEAKYVRIRGDSRVVKRFTRNNWTAFFRPPSAVVEEDFSGLTQKQHLWDTYRVFVQDLTAMGECLYALRRCDPLLRSPLWSGIPLVLGNWTVLDQVRLYRDTDGVPAGLLTWAWLSEHTVSQLSVTPLHAVHMSELNEGSFLCLCDILGSEAVREQIMHDVHSGLFPEQDIVLLYTAPSKHGSASVQGISRSTGAEAISHWFDTISIEEE